MVTTTADAPPTIGTFAGAPNPVARRQDVTLTAGIVASTDATIRNVGFWFDRNHDGIVDRGDLSLGHGKLVGGSYVLAIRVPGDAPTGDLQLLAVATDSKGFLSLPSATTVTVT